MDESQGRNVIRGKLYFEVRTQQQVALSGRRYYPYRILHICLNSTWWRHQMEHFLRYWPFVRGIHRSPVNSPHKGQWRGTLIFSLICVWINSCVNNREAGDLRCHCAHFDVIVIKWGKYTIYVVDQPDDNCNLITRIPKSNFTHSKLLNHM